MKTSLFLLLFLTLLVSNKSFAHNIDHIIEIQIISNETTKTYYTIFSTQNNSFIFYDQLY